jgi:hypothetical protein
MQQMEITVLPSAPKPVALPYCIGVLACFVMSGAIFAGVGFGICSVNQIPCCVGQTCGGHEDDTVTVGIDSFGPCGGGSVDDDAGICGPLCGSSTERMCAVEKYDCGNSGSHTTTCQAADSCCSIDAARYLSLVGIVCMILFGGILLVVSCVFYGSRWQCRMVQRHYSTVSSQDTFSAKPALIVFVRPAVPSTVTDPVPNASDTHSL